MDSEPDVGSFATERAEVRDGVEIAYVREGTGGYPLLLVHGWPESRRIWWRNIAALADLGLTILMVSSEMEEVIGLSDRIVVFSQRRISGILGKERFSEQNVMQLMTGAASPVQTQPAH